MTPDNIKKNLEAIESRLSLELNIPLNDVRVTMLEACNSGKLKETALAVEWLEVYADYKAFCQE